MHRETTKFKVSSRYLLGLYLVVPLSLIVYYLDHRFFGNFIVKSLPEKPWDIIAFTYIFIYPHIFASALTFANREYMQHYQKRLMIGLLLVSAFVIIMRTVGPYSHYAFIYLFLTFVHAFGQQVGIGKWIGYRHSVNMRFVEIWKYFVFLVFGINLAIWNYKLDSLLVNRLEILLAVLAVPGTFLVWHAIKDCNDRVAKLYFWANHSLVLSIFFFNLQGYILLTYIPFRIIHDLTAFSFYSTHNANRKNGSYKMLYLTPILGILVAGIFNFFYVAIIIDIFVFFHYYTERFSWKNGSYHRQYVALS